MKLRQSNSKEHLAVGNGNSGIPAIGVLAHWGEYFSMIRFFVLFLVDDSRAGLPAQTLKERSSFSNMNFAVTEL